MQDLHYCNLQCCVTAAPTRGHSERNPKGEQNPKWPIRHCVSLQRVTLQRVRSQRVELQRVSLQRRGLQRPTSSYSDPHIPEPQPLKKL